MDTIATINEVFLTEYDDSMDIDSPAVWHGDDSHLLIATAKQADVLVVYDAARGNTLHTVGKPGTGLGELERPNGIIVVNDILFVVERDNARIQVFDLPSFEPRGFIGEDTLIRPYGIFAYAEDDEHHLFITDNYETPEETIPPDHELGKRVWHFTTVITNENIMVTGETAFGDTTGAGVLRKVETIWGDVAQNRLLIADEQELTVKEYTLEGTFTGQVIGDGLFLYEPEGIARWRTDNGSGWWIMTDQENNRTIFHVFNGDTLELAGTFTGSVTANTDGVALTAVPFEAFKRGAFFAVHDDGGVAAFSLEDIGQTLQLW